MGREFAECAQLSARYLGPCSCDRLATRVCAPSPFPASYPRCRCLEQMPGFGHHPPRFHQSGAWFEEPGSHGRL